MSPYNLGYFPEPYPDELIYSVCARFAERMGYPSNRMLKQELFGTADYKTVVDFPTRLSHLASVIPQQVTFQQLLWQHTFYPYYVRYLPSNRLEAIREGVKATRKQGINILLGLASNGIKRPVYLQYCPICAQHEREQYGERYWHRLHQLPAVKVCPTHEVWLEGSDIPVSAQMEYISANCGIRPSSPRKLNLTDQHQQDWLSIAHHSRWLLNHREQDATTPSDLRQRYLTHFIQQGLAAYSGRIKTPKLIERFQERYEPSFLDILGCELEGRCKRNWLACIAQANQVQHPLRHILVINMLANTIGDFFEVRLDRKPFGDCPWPCLNRICPYFQRPVIKKIHEGFSRNKGHKPMATFQCPHCGFTYSRTGPDTNENARFTGRTIQYGDLWNNKLQLLWSRKDVTDQEKAAQLGVCRDTLHLQAQKLGLKEATKNPMSHSKRTLPDIEQNRAQWQEIVASHPNATLADLIATFTDVYWNLKRFDREWLSKHQPQSHKNPALNREQFNWEVFDQQLSVQIAEAAKTLRRATHPIHRVTINAIALTLGLKDGWLHKHLPKLPLSVAEFDAVIEDHETFALRRIQMRKNQWKEQGKAFSRSAFIKACGLSSKFRTERILAVLEDAILELSNISDKTFLLQSTICIVNTTQKGE